jgi:hypothetical protein
MWRRDLGANRKTLRQGSGTDVEEAHYDEVLGSSEFYIYITPNKKPKGYLELKKSLESIGCKVEYPVGTVHKPGPGYQVIKITMNERTIPDEVLRQSHKWAHHRNFLHSFFRPIARPNTRSD